MAGTVPIDLAVVVLCVVLSAFFSSSEAAFLSVQRTARLAHLVQEGVPSARRVSRMLDDPGRLLSTILLGNNLVNVAFTAIITALILDAMSDQGTGIVVATVVGTATLLILGEIIPKTVAVRFPMGVAMLFTRPLRLVELAFWPIVVVLQSASRVADIGRRDDETDASITEEGAALADRHRRGRGGVRSGRGGPAGEGVPVGDRQVREVMTPRPEIVFVERGATLEKFLAIYRDHSHTRFPVFKESTDNIVGILSSKDILRAMASRSIPPDASVTDFTRDVYFVPETKRVAELFEESRRTGNQMAVAIDEFGGVAGLVTIRSLLEEVVGRVGEEGLSAEEEYEALGADTFQIEGGMDIQEAMEELGIELPEGEFDTVAGFVLDALGHIPTEGEQFEYGDLKLEVTKMDGLRIGTIKLTKTRVVDSE